MFKAIGLLAALTALAVAVACGGPGGTARSSASPTLDASVTPKPSPIASPAANTGTIAGHVTTPSEVIVAQLVYAISIDKPDRAFSTETIFGQSAYSIRGVEPGAYHVYATKRPVEPRSDGQVTGALYSAAVPCGLDVSCTDNSPLKVTVTANAITSGVDPIDWYTETALIPAPPPAIVRSHSTVPAGGSAFSTARDAAVAIANGQSATAAIVDGPDACPINLACFWVGTEHDGTNAAYFVGGGGSNGSWLACGLYVYKNNSVWRTLRSRPCAQKAFPADGATGNVFIGLGSTSCVYARNAPGPTGAKVGCVKSGTQVKVFGEPVYAPMSGTNGLWWNLEGRGWMADTYLD